MHRATLPIVSVAVAWFCLGGTAAQAAFIIDTSSGWTGGGYQPLGEYTFGQTFTATSVNILTDFQFSLFQPFDQSPVTVRAYIMVWSGLQPSGPILFESAPVSVSNISGNPTISYLPYNFSTGGLALDPGQRYVAFLSAGRDYSGVPGAAAMAVNFSDSYSGGQYVYIHDQYNFSRLTSPTENWAVSSGEDAIFVADFKSTPAPSSVVLIASGGAMGILIGVFRRLKNAVKCPWMGT
jgi:hypothetical protein